MGRYGMQGTPTSILISRNGRIVHHGFGQQSDMALGAMVAAELAGAQTYATKSLSVSESVRVPKDACPCTNPRSSVRSSSSRALAGADRGVYLSAGFLGETHPHDRRCCQRPYANTVAADARHPVACDRAGAGADRRVRSSDYSGCLSWLAGSGELWAETALGPAFHTPLNILPGSSRLPQASASCSARCF